MAEQEERIAARLKRLRADIGHPTRPGHPLPADIAAEQAGVKHRQWQRWESGETMPRPANLEQVAATFGFDVSEFYESGQQATPSQLDRIEHHLEELADAIDLMLDALVAAKLVAAAERDALREAQSEPSRRRRPA